MKKKIYISGPMTGLPELNRFAFRDAEDSLHDEGYKNIINPHDIGDDLLIPIWFPAKTKWFIYMIFDIKALIFCRSIYMLTGWENSRGAKIELKIAKFLRMKIIYQ